MKKLLKIAQTTLIGGLFFIVPIVLLSIIVVKGLCMSIQTTYPTFIKALCKYWAFRRATAGCSWGYTFADNLLAGWFIFENKSRQANDCLFRERGLAIYPRLYANKEYGRKCRWGYEPE